MSDPRLQLGELSLARGGHLLLRRALAALSPGQTLLVSGDDPALAVHARALARRWGSSFCLEEGGVRLGAPGPGRWAGAERAGESGPGGAVDHPSPRWGLAARGAAVEAGTPAFSFALDKKDLLWTDDAARLYLQAAAAQWDPVGDIDWSAAFTLPDEVEDAVVQVMTFLIENEVAALLVPARFLASTHPHFREILQLLAIQAADEARHVEVFTRRALLRRPSPALSTAGGQRSLQTLLEEPDFALASFLTSVLGEGSFLSLLRFLDHHAPDPVTRSVCRLAAQDEARHVAFGLAHLERHAAREPALLRRLAAAVERRHEALRHTSGLNEEVFDALILLAAGGYDGGALQRGWDAVLALQEEMDSGRRLRLQRLGFPEAEAARLSSLHTRNFM